MNKNWIIGIVVAVAFIGIAVVAMNQNNKQEIAGEKQNESMMAKIEVSMEAEKMAQQKIEDKMMADKNAMMKDDKPSGESMEKEDSMVKKAGAYKDYSADTVNTEQAQGQKVVLFFHAPWCPFCKTANTAFLNKTGEIPSGVTVLKTDYDSNTELKKKYGVTYQHTFVQIDQQGNMVTKWNAGDIESLIKNIK